MLEGKMFFFYIITIIVVIGILYYLHNHARSNRMLGVSLAFILGGAIGNFIDRLVRKEVVDFFDFNIFGYDYPIFNIADSSLVIGIIMLLIASYLEEKRKDHQTNE